MAIYHLHTSPASRSSGKSAVAMAAYRSGSRLIDERTGEIKDYSRKKGISETVLFYPNSVNFERQVLWNMAEEAEKRKDARIAREIRIALPCELDQSERSKLAKEFAQEIVTRYGIAVDLSIHQPDRQGDERNFHAHLLLTTRQITPEGLSEKSDLEKSDKALKQAGKENGKEQILALRQQWENLCNHALERQGREERINAKSYKERNLDLTPTIHLGPTVTAMERKGIETRNGTYNRAIRKNNLRRVLLRKRYKLRQEMANLTHEIGELEKEVKPDIELMDRQEITENIPQKKKKISIDKPPQEVSRIEEILGRNAKIPEKEQTPERKNLSVEEVLKRSREQQEELREKGTIDRQLSVEELLNQKPKINREKGLNRGQDEIER